MWEEPEMPKRKAGNDGTPTFSFFFYLQEGILTPSHLLENPSQSPKYFTHLREPDDIYNNQIIIKR